jgi:hypothetical protein
VKSALAFALALLLATPAIGQTRSTPLRDAVSRVDAVRLGTAPVPPRATQGRDSWPARHPILLGTLAGLGVGATTGYATCRYPGVEGPCSYYTYPGRARMAGAWFLGGVGAGIGAGVGALISAALH